MITQPSPLYCTHIHCGNRVSIAEDTSTALFERSYDYIYVNTGGWSVSDSWGLNWDGVIKCPEHADEDSG